jgi:hypothetical protein
MARGCCAGSSAGASPAPDTSCCSPAAAAAAAKYHESAHTPDGPATTPASYPTQRAAGTAGPNASYAAPLTRQKPAKAADIALLPAQRRIDALLDGHPIPTFAGEKLEPAAYLRDLRALSALLHKLQWPFRTSRQLLDQPRALASVLPEALRLADLPDKTAFSDALRNHFDLHHQLLAPIVLHQLSPFRHALQHTASEATSDPTLPG